MVPWLHVHSSDTESSGSSVHHSQNRYKDNENLLTGVMSSSRNLLQTGVCVLVLTFTTINCGDFTAGQLV